MNLISPLISSNIQDMYISCLYLVILDSFSLLVCFWCLLLLLVLIHSGLHPCIHCLILYYEIHGNLCLGTFWDQGLGLLHCAYGQKQQGSFGCTDSVILAPNAVKARMWFEIFRVEFFPSIQD